MSRRKIFILTYSTIFLTFAVPYVLFLYKYYNLKKTIHERENREEAAFYELKRQLEGNQNLQYSFDDYFSLEASAHYTKQRVSYFIYWDDLRERHLRPEYLYCLQAKVKSANSKAKAEADLEKELKQLEYKHGDLVRQWLRKIGKNEFFTIKNVRGCTEYFEPYQEYSFDPIATEDFDNFLNELKARERSAAKVSSENQRVYEEVIERTRASLNDKERRIFDEEIKRVPALVDEYTNFRFDGKHLDFPYHIPFKAFDRKRLEDALIDVYNERYSDYSLKTGDMPYGYCYGKQNNGNRFVRVEAGHRDVLVTIKNRQQRVVRHVYIQAYDRYTLRLTPGKYQVFFYYGKGWNPMRFMKPTYCGDLLGGFLAQEYVQKDDEWIDLDQYDSFSYMLRSTNGGNFQPSGSDKNEAF